MNELFTPECISSILRFFAFAILAVLFIQSGFDKVFDWKGNLGWLKGHFAKTIFKNSVPLLLGLVTILEVASGLASAGGALDFGCREWPMKPCSSDPWVLYWPWVHYSVSLQGSVSLKIMPAQEAWFPICCWQVLPCGSVLCKSPFSPFPDTKRKYFVSD